MAYLHVDDGDPETAPPILVTASMERLEVRDDTLALDEDYNWWEPRLGGAVVARDRRGAKAQEGDAVALSAVFTFVARKRDGSWRSHGATSNPGDAAKSNNCSTRPRRSRRSARRSARRRRTPRSRRRAPRRATSRSRRS